MTKQKILTILLLVSSLTWVQAQPGGGPGGGGDPGHGRPVPISGIEVLLVLGGILGVRKHLKSPSRK
jgi:hypothetical protein